MLNQQSQLSFVDKLPSVVDVVVIGGGIIGVSIAWFLAQRGVSVAICEKGRIAGEQSSRNWGWIRKHGRDRAELPIVIESIEHWKSIADSLDEDIGFSRHGVLYLAQSEAELQAREQWLAIARDHQLDTRMLTGAEVGRLISDKSQNWVGGAYTPSDARAEPALAVPAMARALHRRGVQISENCAVRGLSLESGSVGGVLTEKGAIRCSSVVCAGGAWASMFCRNLGFGFPQLAVRATVARTTVAPNIFDGNASGGGLAFRRRLDGGYTLASGGYLDHFICRDSFRYFVPFTKNLLRSYADISLRFGRGDQGCVGSEQTWDEDQVTPFERDRVLNPSPSKFALRDIRERLDRLLPSISKLPFAATWAGMIDTTPDVVPVIDQVAALPGFYVAAGFSGHGFGIGPGAGRVMADMILGNSLGHDLTRFRFDRFTDGSVLELGPAL